MKTLASSVIVLSGLLSAAAHADPPDGTFKFKDNQVYDQECLVGRYSSQITQNGQFVSGNNEVGIDQTTYPGSRADEVHALLESCRANGAEDEED